MTKLKFTKSEDISPDSIEKAFILVVNFTEEAFGAFLKEFVALERNENVETIVIYISSYGGYVDCLNPMRDLIKSCTKPVATVVLGKAMSCGVCLAASGTPGYRFAAPTCSFMIHEISGGAHGKHADIEITAEEMKRINKVTMTNLAQDMGKSYKWLMGKLHDRKNTDWYMDSKGALDLGIIDHIGIPRVNFTKQEKVPQKTVLIKPEE